MQTRRFVQIAAMFTTVAAIVACNPFASKHQVGQIDPQNSGANTAWNATLSTPGGMTGAVDLHGTASLAASGQNKSRGHRDDYQRGAQGRAPVACVRRAVR